MRSGQHGHVFPFKSQPRQIRNDLVQQRQHHPFCGALQRQRNGRVVDVLRCQPKVDKLLPSPQAQLVHCVFQEIFDGFHIMVGDALLVFHPLGILG